jgi:hypothetical protein
MYGRGVLFVPGTRWGGVRKASTVWRQVATARGSESSAAKSVLGICGGADTEFRMDRSRERSLKHQRCRPKECQRREKGSLQLIEAPRKPQPNADSQTSPVPTPTPNRC